MPCELERAEDVAGCEERVGGVGLLEVGAEEGSVESSVGSMNEVRWTDRSVHPPFNL